MSEWKECKLGELIDVKHGFAFKGEFFQTEPNENILITPGNFKIGGGWKEDKCKYYNGEIPEDYILKAGDLIVTMTDLSKEVDTLGYSAIVPSDPNRTFLHNQRIGLIIQLNSDADLSFLNWLMRTPEYRFHVVSSASGSTVGHTSPSRIKEYVFNLPPLPEQRAIASVLSCLDDKIDLLHRQNKTLEAMAETLFRQWFVEGVDVGWEEKPLSSIAEHKKYNVKPDQNPATIYRHYSIPAFDDGKQPVMELGSEIKSNKYQVVPNSILISKLNPRFPRVWAITDLMDENSICSTEFQVVYPTQAIYYGFIYCLLKSKQVTEELIGAAGGTSGSHQRVKPEDIFNLSFQMPPNERIGEFNLIASDHLKKVSTNTKQIRILEKLRDTLLPKLVSGEVRVEMEASL